MLFSCVSHPLRRSAPIRLLPRSEAPLRSFSATIPQFQGHKSNRRKLQIGFTSLSTNLPFSQNKTLESPGILHTKAHDASELDPRASIMLTALRGGVSAIDCPAPPLLDGSGSLSSPSCWISNRQGDIDTANSLDAAWETLVEEDDGEAMAALYSDGAAVSITTRLGYRAAVSARGTDEDETEQEGKFIGDSRIGVLDPGTASVDGDGEWAKPPVALVHNLGQDYVLFSLRTSPLVQRYKLGSDGMRKVSIVSLAHNPESLISSYLVSQNDHASSDENGTPMERAHKHMKQCLTSAFIGYEMAVKEGLIDGYGVDSNGLSLPNDHDMHYGWRDVLECAADAYLQVYGQNSNGRSSLKVIRMPGNLLETRGLEVANEIHSFFGDSEEGLSDDPNLPDIEQRRRLRPMRQFLPESIEVNITRPLTAFPYGGTGWEPNASPGLTENSGAPPLFLEKRGTDGKKIDSTHPIRILDYRIDSGPLGQVPHEEWTNYHYNHHGLRPSLYQVRYNNLSTSPLSSHLHTPKNYFTHSVLPNLFNDAPGSDECCIISFRCRFDSRGI